MPYIQDETTAQFSKYRKPGHEERGDDRWRQQRGHVRWIDSGRET